MTSVQIGDKLVGDGHPVFVTAEIGINHNGNILLAKELIDAAVDAGCNAVKFQKRTVFEVYTLDELGRQRESPFGTTNGDLKLGLEFGQEDYERIDAYCHKQGVLWTASCWDSGSVDFIDQFDPPYYKVASASLTDDDLLRHIRSKGKPVILSTGMSTMVEIDHAVEVLGEEDLIILHCTSTYPAQTNELNLRMIETLQVRYDVPTGYSGHEVGLQTTLAAVALGASMVERHVTLDRSMWGSDQAASVEPQGFQRLVRDIRVIETAMGDGVKRVYESEVPVRDKLRRAQGVRHGG